MNLPQLPADAFTNLPRGVELAGSPVDLRIFQTATTIPFGPAPNLPSSPAESEIIWRLMVAMHLHGQWAAVITRRMIEHILAEQSNPEAQMAPDTSAFKVNDQNIHKAIDLLVDTIWELTKHGWIGHAGNIRLIWLTPQAIENCQVPAHSGTEYLLKI